MRGARRRFVSAFRTDNDLGLVLGEGTGVDARVDVLDGRAAAAEYTLALVSTSSAMELVAWLSWLRSRVSVGE